MPDANSIESLNSLLTDLPIELTLAAAVVVLLGILLWAFGSRVLKPAFVVAGIAIGGAAGYLAGIALDLDVPEWLFAVAGAIGLGLLAFLAYRAAMGLCLALLFGLTAPLLVVAWADFRGVEAFPETENSKLEALFAEDGDATPDADIMQELRDLQDKIINAENLSEEAQRLLEEKGGGLFGLGSESTDIEYDEDGNPLPPQNPPAWREQLDRVIEIVREEAKARWDATPQGVRRSLVLSTACGAIFGLLLGLAAPKFSASLVTVLSGSAMMLTGGWTLVEHYVPSPPDWIPSNSTAWGLTWLGLAAVGMAIQWTLRAKPADKSK